MTRAGFSTQGSPASLNVLRSMRGSLARRITLRRPKEEEIEALEAEIAALEKKGGSERRIAALKTELEVKKRRRKTIAYIDPIDIRYNRFERLPRPATQAVIRWMKTARSGSSTLHSWACSAGIARFRPGICRNSRILSWKSPIRRIRSATSITA